MTFSFFIDSLRRGPTGVGLSSSSSSEPDGGRGSNPSSRSHGGCQRPPIGPFFVLFLVESGMRMKNDKRMQPTIWLLRRGPFLFEIGDKSRSDPKILKSASLDFPKGPDALRQQNPLSHIDDTVKIYTDVNGHKSTFSNQSDIFL